MSDYAGAACPRCGRAIELKTSGEVNCPRCQKTFEARVFSPHVHVTQVTSVDSLPEATTPCINHARNAAICNCDRCGAFICALCEVATGGGRFCPSCFDRLTAEGTIDSSQAQFRDYRSLSTAAALAGLIMSVPLGIPLGILTIYYSVRARRDGNVETSTFHAVVVGTIGLLDMGIGTALLLALFMGTSK